MRKEFCIALVGASMFAPLAGAQVRIAAIGHPTGPGLGISPGPVRSAASGFHTRAGTPRGQRASILLSSPYFYADDFSSLLQAEAPAPQVVIMQAPPAAEAAEEPRPEPLLI